MYAYTKKFSIRLVAEVALKIQHLQISCAISAQTDLCTRAHNNSRTVSVFCRFRTFMVYARMYSAACTLVPRANMRIEWMDEERAQQDDIDTYRLVEMRGVTSHTNPSEYSPSTWPRLISIPRNRDLCRRLKMSARSPKVKIMRDPLTRSGQFAHGKPAQWVWKVLARRRKVPVPLHVSRINMKS